MTTLAQLVALGIRAPPQFVVNNLAELQALVAAQGAAGLSGKTIQLNAGNYGSTIITDFAGLAPAQRLTLVSHVPLGTLTPGFSLSDASNITLKNLVCYRLRADDTVTNHTGAVIFAQDSADCWIDGCEIWSDALSGVDFSGYINVSGGSGTFTDGEPVSTSGGGTGVYRAGRAHSTSTRFAITKIKTLAANPLTVTNGSAVVVVSDPGHCTANGANVTIRNAAAVGGITPNGTFPVTYVDPNSYSYVYSSNATSDATGGGSSVRVAPDDMSGNSAGGAVSAWSAKTLTGETSGATRTIASWTASSAVNFCTDLLDGVGPESNLHPSHGLRVTNCYIHDVAWPVNSSGRNMIITGNRLIDAYKSFFNFNGDISGLTLRANRGMNVWAVDSDGQASATGGQHSSLFGFSQRGYITTLGLIEGNALAVGVRRAMTRGGQGFATGPKMNDVPNPLVYSISGTVLTVVSESPSGVISTSTPVGIGQRVFGTGVSDCYITGDHSTDATLTGTGGAGTYRVSVSQSVAQSGTSRYIASYYIGFDFLSNLFVCNGNIGIQYSAGTYGEIAYNTVISDRSSNPQTNKPSLYFSDWLYESSAHHNVVNSFSNGYLAGGSDAGQPLADTWRSNSWDNVIAFQTAGSGPGALENLYAGPNFTLTENSTIDDVLAMFASKVGGRVHGTCGHDAYYNFTTNTSNYPVVSPPTTTTANGVDLTGVNFSTGDRLTWSVISTENILQFATGDTLTWVIHFNRLDANQDVTAFSISGFDFWLRLLADSSDNLVRITVKDSAGVSPAIQIDPSFQMETGEDAQIVISLDIPNYVCCVVKNGVLDAFSSVSAWNGVSMRLTANSIAVADNTSGTDLNAGTYKLFAADDSFIDFRTSAGLSKIWALDGKPANFGATGTTLFGHRPRALITGAASVWNAGTNAGSAGNFVMTGAVT